MALCLPERLQHTAHSQSKVTTASSSGDIWEKQAEICVIIPCFLHFIILYLTKLRI